MPGDPLRLDRFPRFPLCHRPTPIEALDRLSDHLGGPRLLVKRDDCTGLATGGNKTRKLEFLLGRALQDGALQSSALQDGALQSSALQDGALDGGGADTVVTVGAPQSNHVRQTAAAAARAGIGCHAVLQRWQPDGTSDYYETGNVLLDGLFGATVHWFDAGTDLAEASAELCRELAADGHRPYLVPVGGSTAVGALGYVDAAAEIAAHRPGFDHLVTATASTGTHAGLLAGFTALEVDLPIIGISVKRRAEELAAMVRALADETTALLGTRSIPNDAVVIDDRSIGPGYGIPDESTIEAIELTARLEGLLLDPVYTGKAMAGLIRLVRDGFFESSDRVLFLHTGGSQALYAYRGMLTGATAS